MSARLSEQARAEAISKILYPSDATPAGRELRLRQEYFFVSASLQDLVRGTCRSDGDLRRLPDRASIQLNDTHPSIAVAELMRLLLDEYGMPWDVAWGDRARTFSYTNHTLLPEALETLAGVADRAGAAAAPADHLPHQRRASGIRAARCLGFARARLVGVMIDEHGGRHVRMGHLAFIGSHRVNGVSALHTELMRKTVFADLHALYPDRIVNKTNGITFRRWLLQANPGLVDVVRTVCGDGVLDDPGQARRVCRSTPATAACTSAGRRGQARQQDGARRG